MKKIQTDWNLKLLYSSINDSKIDADIAVAENAINKFEKKYKNKKDYLNSEESLYRAISEYENILSLGLFNSAFYLHYVLDLDSSNEKARAKNNLITQKLDNTWNKTIFFFVALSKISTKQQKIFLKSKKLEKYRYFLKKIFNESKHVLSEDVEKVLSLKNLTSKTMWENTTDKLLNSLVIEHKGEKLPLAQVSNLIHDLSSHEERVILHQKYMQKLSEVAPFAEAEMNAIVTDKKINDELRGFKQPFDATILSYENDTKMVENLVHTVSNSFSVSQRFFKVKAKMLGLKKLSYADRAAKVGNIDKKINFQDSVEILKNVFSKVDPAFEKILTDFLGNGQIDVFPKKGKTSGAYCSHSYNTPTLVLLNHTNSFKSLSTFAHEMGHAIHSEFSRKLSPLYSDYSIATAEVASTLFESFVFYSELEKMSEKEKVVALHDKISDDVQTIFRQIACFNFEVEMHKTIRENGQMTKEEIGKVLNKHMKSYLGESFELTDLDGNFFVTWSHLRRFFYVYSYAFGQLASKAIYEKYSKDNTYISDIKKFLSRGGSMSPEDIFKSIGIDTRNPNFWKSGIRQIEEDIKMLEKLTSSIKL